MIPKGIIPFSIARKRRLQLFDNVAFRNALFMGIFEMVDPFKYSGLVTGKDFADRESEMDKVLKEIRSGTNIVLFFLSTWANPREVRQRVG